VDCISKASPADSPDQLSALKATFHLIGDINDAGNDPYLENLAGDGTAREIAEKWSESGRVRSLLEGTRPWLDDDTRTAVDHILGWDVRARMQEPSPRRANLYGESDDETDDDSQKGHMAHFLFADGSQKRWISTSNSSSQRTSSPCRKSNWGSAMPASSPSRSSGRIGRKIPPSSKHDLPRFVTSHAKLDSVPSKATPTRTQAPELLADVNNYVEARFTSPGDGSPNLTFTPISKRRKIAAPGTTLELASVPKSTSGLENSIIISSQTKRSSTRSPERSQRSLLSSSSSQATERRVLHSERLKIGERLSRARPDLVLPTYAATRARLLSERLQSEIRDEYMQFMRTSALALHPFEVDTGEKEISEFADGRKGTFRGKSYSPV
jgi:hypothetical protein